MQCCKFQRNKRLLASWRKARAIGNALRLDVSLLNALLSNGFRMKGAVLARWVLFCVSGWGSLVNAAEPAVAAATDPKNPSVWFVYLTNGDRLSGELIAEDAQHLVLKTAYHPSLSLAKSQIQRVVDPTQDRQEPTPATTQADTQILAQSPAAVAETPPKDAKPAAKQSWQLEVDVSAAKRRGKESSESISTAVNWEFRLDKWRYSSDASFDYEIKQEVRKTHKYAINPGLDYFYNEQIFGRVQLDFSYDYLAADYKNIDFSLGPGFSFFRDQQELRLELMALVGVKNAYFRGDQFLQAFLGYQDSVSFRFASLDYDYQYEWPNTGWEWYAKGSYLTMLDQPIAFLDFAYEWRNEFGIRYWLTDKIRLSWSMVHDKTAIDLDLGDGMVLPLDVKDIRQKLSIGASF